MSIYITCIFFKYNFNCTVTLKSCVDFRYLFVHGPQKKIVEMEVEGDGANLQQLKVKACVLFGLPDVAMQSWDKGFEEWADCEVEDIVPTNTKLLVREVLSKLVLDDSTTSTSSSVEDTVTSDCESTRYVLLNIWEHFIHVVSLQDNPN